MIIAVSSSGKDLDSSIDPRFGRCAYFIIYNTDNGHMQVFDNKNISLGGGAGIQSAQFIASKDAKAVITGNCGPNAVKTLNTAGIQLFLGQTGSVREGIEKFSNNMITPSQQANVTDHFGVNEGIPSPPSSNGNIDPGWMVTGRGGGMGRGGGGGMGMCGGKGMGRGMGRGMGLGRGVDRGFVGSQGGISPEPATTTLSRGQELNLLKQQSKNLRQQMDDIQARIRTLEENG